MNRCAYCNTPGATYTADGLAGEFCDEPCAEFGRDLAADRAQTPASSSSKFVLQCTVSEGGLRCLLDEGHAAPHEFDFVPKTAPTAEHVSNERTKAGKPRLELVDLDFVAEMARQFEGGLKGDRKPNDWQKLDPAEWRDQYVGAVLRHVRAARKGVAVTDPETGASEWAAVAVNALIVWWFEEQLRKAKPRS